MGVLPGAGEVGRQGQMPVFHAVLNQPLVKRVVELAVQVLEVPVATRVGLLVGRHVCDDHLELHAHTNEHTQGYAIIMSDKLKFN